MISIRIYNNGDYVINNVRPEHIDDHINYNTIFRFGCALVIDDVIKNNGYLEEDRIKNIISKIDVSKYTSYTKLPYN